MHEIEKLEKRWIKYRFKKFIKNISFFVIIVLSTYVLLKIYYFNNTEKIVINKHKNINTNHISERNVSKLQSQKESNVSKKLTSKEISKEKKEVFLKPSIAFLSNIKSKEEKKKEEKRKKIDKNIKKEVTKNSQQIKKINTPQPKSKIVIKTKSNEDIIDSIIKKFEKNPDPKLAIFLSKTFYKDKDYKKSLYWAIKANELDSSNYQSWILFAKASVKLGKKNDAINALRAYLKNHNSYEAKKLLIQISNGEFR
ncbi:CDC27 family protein [Nitrosophilus kaiyonis]|uniref:CDC27 family protein n=1 Tax=Nitrosophilus kaiyonis TaxID=2930200 RepID=UPI0024924F04|nr:CDC27 family protein [Nitrosophilus kaiyonis]